MRKEPCIKSDRKSESERNNPDPNSKNATKRLQEKPCSTSDPQRKRVRLPTVDRALSDQNSFIKHWVHECEWPEAGFEPEAMGFRDMDILARKKSTLSESSNATPSDQKPREIKSCAYTNAGYQDWLETKGVWMGPSELGISDDSKTLCQQLLDTECDIPENTLFDDEVFEQTITELECMNEQEVIRGIAGLLVPTVWLAKRSDKRLSVLTQSMNKGWNNCFPLTNPRPQPDFAVGFSRLALGDERIKKLRAVVGDELLSDYQSRLMATHYMFFPFFTSEAKSGNAGFRIAERQNAHSMGVAVGSIVFIYQLAKRQAELHRRLLTFSVSHSHSHVTIYGWYPIFEGDEGDDYTVHRHLVRDFGILDMDGQEKWTTYKFSIGVYRYSLKLLESINNIIDELPADLNLGDILSAQQQTGLLQGDVAEDAEHSGPSQQLEDQSLSNEIPDSQSINPQVIMPNTSIADRVKSRVLQKRNGRKAL